MAAYPRPPSFSTGIPEVQQCIGCGAPVSGNFGIADPLCPACEQSQIRADAEQTIAGAIDLVLGRGAFARLSVADRQELLGRRWAEIGQAPNAEENPAIAHRLAQLRRCLADRNHRDWHRRFFARASIRALCGIVRILRRQSA